MENDLPKRVKSIGNLNNFTLIVVQRSILIEILSLLHEQCELFGMAKTFDRVQVQFCLLGMRKVV